jgi:hypothetical protein
VSTLGAVAPRARLAGGNLIKGEEAMTLAASEQTTGNLWAALGLGMALLACAAFGSLLQAGNTPLQFSRAGWISAAGSHDESTRLRMANALVRESRLVGMSGMEVAVMLGDPAYDADTHADMAWRLGASHHGNRVSMLVVMLDASGLVTAAEIVGA